MKNKYYTYFRCFFSGIIFLFLLFIFLYLNNMMITYLSEFSDKIIYINFLSMIILMIGIMLSFIISISIYYILYIRREVVLPRAIRITEAMNLLHSVTDKEKFRTIKFYSLKMYKANNELDNNVANNIKCKETFNFFSPALYHSDRLKYLGSSKICCNFDDIKNIIDNNKMKWCYCEYNDGNHADIDDKIKQLKKENKEIKLNSMACNARNTQLSDRVKQLKYQITNINKNISILVRLASIITKENKPRRTKDQIRAKYSALGKEYGMKKISEEHLELFRKAIPAEFGLINSSGPPTQAE